MGAACVPGAGARAGPQRPRRCRDAKPLCRPDALAANPSGGADAPERPDVSALRRDFAVKDAGGAANNSQSITIINGRVTRNVQRGYTFQFQIAPKREGDVIIPPVTVRADSASTVTNSIRLHVSPPAEIHDFRLKQSLSKSKVYVGEPVMLTTTWYVGRNVDQFAFTMPLLDDKRFETFDPRESGRRGSETVDVPVGESRVTAIKDERVLDGYQMVAVEFRKAVVARTPGTMTLEPTVVSFRAIRASAARPRSLFDDFFGDSFLARSAATSTSRFRRTR
ncbi:MAG: BatD family protein [Bryobacterales bacterium]